MPKKIFITIISIVTLLASFSFLLLLQIKLELSIILSLIISAILLTLCFPVKFKKNEFLREVMKYSWIFILSLIFGLIIFFLLSIFLSNYLTINFLSLFSTYLFFFSIVFPINTHPERRKKVLIKKQIIALSLVSLAILAFLNQENFNLHEVFTWPLLIVGLITFLYCLSFKTKP